MLNPDQSRKLKDFDDLNEELEFLFNSYIKGLRSPFMPSERGWKPLTDMYETSEEIVVVMDIAGITTRDIKPHLEGKFLILRGIRREHPTDSKRKYHKMEIDFGPFERRIELPGPVDPDGVTARYSQGFLEIRLPKKEAPPSRSVEIKIL